MRIRSYLPDAQPSFMVFLSALELTCCVREYDSTCIREAFEGYIRTESICGACGWRSDQLEPFKHLPLAFKDVHDVEAALRMKTAKQSVCDATCPG